MWICKASSHQYFSGCFFLYFILLCSSFPVFCNKCLVTASKWKAPKMQQCPVLEKQITLKDCSQEKQEEENTFERGHEWCHRSFHRALGWFWTFLTSFQPEFLSLAGKFELNPHQVTNQTMFQIKTGQILKMLGGNEAPCLFCCMSSDYLTGFSCLF